MEPLSAAWFSGLAAIVLIDLVLAGDNALVIALAARRLPPVLRRRAIVWGTVGALLVRVLMTIGAVWLLKIPVVMLVGGIGLVWVAYKLLLPSSNHEGEDHAASDFWGAMRTIVVADALMGVDNVLGIAGAANGAFDLVILGLLISVPIVAWGSGLVLRWVDRYPMITYLGAAVLAATAAGMIVNEPLLDPVFDAFPARRWAVYAIVVVGVLLAGRIAARRGRAAGTA
jgi:YjbE family integral membrane protein